MSSWYEDNRMKFDKFLKAIPTMTEKDFRTMEFSEIPYPRSWDDLFTVLHALADVKYNDKDGRTIEATAYAALMTFNFFDEVHGHSGYSLSCSGLEFFRLSRWMKDGLFVIDYHDLLFPHLLGEDHFPTYKTLLEKNKKYLTKRAKELIAEDKPDMPAHPDVYNWWTHLAGLPYDEEANTRWEAFMKRLKEDKELEKEADEWGKTKKEE